MSRIKDTALSVSLIVLMVEDTDTHLNHLRKSSSQGSSEELVYIYLDVHVCVREKETERKTIFLNPLKSYKATLVLLREISPNGPDISACRSDIS